MRQGVRIGVDVGSRRVGVARSDATGALAVPVQTLARGRGDLEALVALVHEHEAVEVVVGLPLGLDGSEGDAARLARAYAEQVAAAVAPVPVRTLDERLTTVTAQRGLQEAGRSVRTSRDVVDQAAAVVIVQHALDAERASGSPAGEPVEVAE
jgi:putative Holliday junction resolvase